MAEQALTVKDAASSTRSLGSQTVAALEYTGHYNKAVPFGGASFYRNLDLGTTGQVVKASAGTLLSINVFNQAYIYSPSGTQERYLKIYDKATAPTSADTPVWTIPLWSNDPAISLPASGLAFANGISIRATTGIADNNNVAPGTNDVVVNLAYA